MYKKQLSVRGKIAGGVFLLIVFCLWAYGQVSTPSSNDASSTVENPLLLSGNVVATKSAIGGCHTTKSFDKFITLLNEDEEAARKFFGGADDCDVIKVDTRGKIEDTSAWRNAVCFRPDGEPDCYWIPMNAAERSN